VPRPDRVWIPTEPVVVCELVWRPFGSWPGEGNRVTVRAGGESGDLAFPARQPQPAGDSERQADTTNDGVVAGLESRTAERRSSWRATAARCRTRAADGGGAHARWQVGGMGRPPIIQSAPDESRRYSWSGATPRRAGHRRSRRSPAIRALAGSPTPTTWWTTPIIMRALHPEVVEPLLQSSRCCRATPMLTRWVVIERGSRTDCVSLA
jgi:hypothetical protein